MTPYSRCYAHHLAARRCYNAWLLTGRESFQTHMWFHLMLAHTYLTNES